MMMIYIYITGQEFNKLTSETFTVRLAQANLASKSDNASSIKKTDLDKSELNEVSKMLMQINKRINKRFDK